MSQLSVVTSPVVNVVVTSSVTSFSSEKHFQKDLTVAALKASCGYHAALCGSVHVTKVVNYIFHRPGSRQGKVYTI